MFIQKNIVIAPRPRGFHLITTDILHAIPEIKKMEVGMLFLFLQHTSASLTINENADPTVRGDFERFINRLIPENQPYYQHDYEGSDDMPAHLKSSLLGNSLQIPISNGELGLGTWQGVYLGEHRNHGGSRRLLATLQF